VRRKWKGWKGLDPNEFQEHCPFIFDGDSMMKLEGIDPGSIW